ncbi:MAG: HAMP domain-containing protein [Euryarchaeota archaeon]|nr:HAMP domain-containing protein [Euryarchaeota archaeon]MBU4607232.1 HAMP domain-containing protein [Euryarchaeota archaeon]MBV1755273.1 HAMP domain-containing protein [Methanobacterium sp.]
MNLRKKTLLMIGATLLALVLILYATSQIILVSGLTNLEEDNIKQDAARFEEAFLREQYNLNTFARDMASSDETYNFMLNQNQQFIDDNLDDNSFSSIRIDIILFLDNQGRLVYVKRLDRDNEVLSTLPEGMEDYNFTPLLLFNDSTPSQSGIINLPDKPLLISASPVTGSSPNSTALGAVLMGQDLNKHFISSFSNFTQLRLEIIPYNLTDLGGDFQDAKAAFNGDETIFIIYNGSESISAYGFLKDIENNPAIIFKITDSRLYYAKALNSIYYFMAMIIIAGFVMGFSILIYLDKSVLSRLSHLSANIKLIGEKKDFSARFPVSGDDEFSLLTRSLNKMMEKLENSHLTLQKSEKKFRQLAENMNEVFCIFDLKNKRSVTSAWPLKISGVETPRNCIMIPVIGGSTCMPMIIQIGVISFLRHNGKS